MTISKKPVRRRIRRLWVIIGTACIVGLFCVAIFRDSHSVDYNLGGRMRKELASGNTALAWNIIDRQNSIYGVWVTGELCLHLSTNALPSREIERSECVVLLQAAIRKGGGVAWRLYRQSYDAMDDSQRSWLPPPDGMDYPKGR